MTPQDISASFEERQRAVASLRELADTTQGRDMTAEETQTFERQNADIDALDARIESGLSVMERETKATTALESFRSMNQLSAPVEAAVDPGQSDKDLFRQLLNGEIRSFESKPESRDLSTGTAAKGGNLITSTLYDRVIELFTEDGAALRAGATLLQTERGEDMLIPTVTAYSTGAKVAELAAISESDPAFGQSTLSTYAYAAIVQASNQLLQDNGVGNFNIMNFIGDQGGSAVARAWSAALTTGDGTGDPQGFNRCAIGKTAASATAIVASELFDMQHSITAPYRNGASWVMNDSTVKALRLLVDGNGIYVWSPGLTAGSPDTLLGAPVYSDPNMAAIASGNWPIVYGNFTRGYFARIAGGVRVEQSNAPGFANDLESFRFIVRGGGCLVDLNALRKLAMA